LNAQKKNQEKILSIKINALETKIEGLKAQKENLEKKLVFETNAFEIEIKNLQADKKFLAAQIESLNYKKGNLQNIKILRPPVPPLFHIKSRIKRNIAMAIVGGVFVMLLIVLLMEAVAGAKDRKDYNMHTEQEVKK
jgi:uncharacterized protein involved in exopolysaccharide biosynthesis